MLNVCHVDVRKTGDRGLSDAAATSRARRLVQDRRCHACRDQSPTSCVRPPKTSRGVSRVSWSAFLSAPRLSSLRPTNCAATSANGHARFVLPRCSNRAVRPTGAPTAAVVRRALPALLCTSCFLRYRSRITSRRLVLQIRPRHVPRPPSVLPRQGRAPPLRGRRRTARSLATVVLSDFLRSSAGELPDSPSSLCRPLDSLQGRRPPSSPPPGHDGA